MTRKKKTKKTKGGGLGLLVALGIVVWALGANTCGMEERGGEPLGRDPRGFEPEVELEGGIPRTLPQIPVAARGNRRIESYTTAKNAMYDVHREGQHELTFYCGCTYKDRRVSRGSCGYTVRTDAERAGRTEAEHVMPAARFGHAFLEWTEGSTDCGVTSKGAPKKGRSCAQKLSKEFSLMEADIFNLQPAIGEVNGDRKDYEWGEIGGEERRYGRCDVEIQDRQVEPRPGIRGDIARTYLYMAWAYPERVTLAPQELRMFQAWDRMDPADKWEVARTRAMEKIQGNLQPFVP